MIEKKDFTSDLDLQFFASSQFEDSSDNPFEHANITGRNALRALMMGWQDVSPLWSSQVRDAIFFKRDPELLRGMRLAFQQGFEYLYETQLKDSHLSPHQHEQVQLYLSNCMALLPFSDITPYESFKIPQWIDGTWQLVDYKVVPIELTPSEGLNKLFIYDEDRVYAYGLEPISNDAASPHLIFMGTTYPAGQGFLSQINTDLEPFETVGKQLYRTGVDKITAWLNKQTQKTHVCGMSLGGALSLILAMHQGDKLSRVDVLNPAGFYDAWIKSQFDLWDTFLVKPIVVIQRQGNDLVSRLGNWKKDWLLIDVIPPAVKRGPNFIVDHALNYAGIIGTSFKYVKDMLQDNQQRKMQNLLIYVIARAVIYYGVMMPYHYLIHPPLHYMLAHKRETAIIGITAACMFAFPMLAAPFFATLGALNLVLSALILGAIVNLAISFAEDKINNKHESSPSRALSWFQHQSLSTQALVSVITVTAIVGLLFVPLPILTLGYLIAAIPSVIKLLHQGMVAANIVLGSQKDKIAALHDPYLPRNASMDMYQTKVQKTVSVHDIETYCKAKKSIHAEDAFELSLEQKMVRITDNSEDNKLVIEASTAEFDDLKRVVKLVHQFGLHKPETLKPALVLQEREYALGKLGKTSY